MNRLLEDLSKMRSAANATGAAHLSSPRSLALPLLLASLVLAAAPASADDDPFGFRLVENLRYKADWEKADYELRPPSFSYRLNEERSVEAPTRFRIKSMLRYTMPIGNTGMYLRLSAPLKKRKIVKISLRF